MASVKIGHIEEHDFIKGVFRIRLGGAPQFTFDGSASQKKADDFGLELAKRSFGKVQLPTLRFPFRLAGWSKGNPLNDGKTKNKKDEPDYEFSISGEVVDEHLASFLAAPAKGPDQIPVKHGHTLVYQIWPNETPNSLLKRIVGDEVEIRPDEAGEALVAPPTFGCLLRPGAMSARDFFDLVIGVIGAESPALVGWRVLPSYEGGMPSALSFVLSDQRDNVLKLSTEAWLPCASAGDGKNGSALTLRHKMRTPYAELEDVLRGLFSSGIPRPDLFGTDDPIPGAPCWIQYDMIEWFAEEIVVQIANVKSVENEQKAQIKEIDLVLQQGPNLPVPAALPARIARARVKEWSENGDTLVVTPEDGANWEVAGSDTLDVDCLTPAHFSEERSGGIYCRPHLDDPRHVLLLQGQPPVSAGASMLRIEEIEDKEVDIEFRGAALELVGGGARLSARSGELKANAEELVEFTGTTQVQGTLDVS